MTPQRIEFARALELVCRALNPPHRPLPAALAPAELGLAGLALRADDPLLAYRYLRGLELDGGAPSGGGSGGLWAAEAGLMAAATAVAEVEPGTLAIGDVSGWVRVFTHAGRGRWECAATLRAHAGAVPAIVPLGRGDECAMLSVSNDGTVAVSRRDARGGWRRAEPDGFAIQGPLFAACRLGDGTAIVGGAAGRKVELRALPSGDWQAEGLLSGGADVVALAPVGADGFCEVARNAPVQLWQRSGGGWSSRPLWASNQATDVVSWDEGNVLLATVAGEVVLAGLTREPVVERLAPSPIHALRRFGADGVATISEGGPLRLWRRVDGRFQRLAEFDAALSACMAPLCDGRLVFCDHRGAWVAAPDAGGRWRHDEAVSAYEPGIGLVAALAADRVAYVDRNKRLVVLRVKPADVEVEHVHTQTVAITALAAVDPDTLAFGLEDGSVHALQRPAGDPWRVRPVPLAAATGQRSGAIERLAGGAGWLFCMPPGGLPQAWRRERDDFEPVTLAGGAPAGAGAIAIDRNGVCAIADGSMLSIGGPKGWNSHALTGRHVVQLEWLSSGDLLVLDSTGAATRLNHSPWQESPLHPPLPGSRGIPQAAVLAAGPVVFARGAAGLETDTGLRVAALRGDVRRLAAAGDVLFAGADALYVVELVRTVPAVRRIVVNDDLALGATLDPAGAVTRVELRRRGGRAWTAQQVGDKLLPDDPLLHAQVARHGANGRLAEVGSPLSFSEDRTVFVAEG